MTIMNNKRNLIRDMFLTNNGFTYLSVLFFVTVMGFALGATGKVWSTDRLRDKESDLLYRGNEIRKAIGRYYEGSQGIKSYPKDLASLIKDPRSPTAKRYLRKLYDDPFTGKPDWDLITASGGGIIGVKSKSSLAPLKKNNFPTELANLEGKTKYSEWEFVYKPTPNKSNKDQATNK